MSEGPNFTHGGLDPRGDLLPVAVIGDSGEETRQRAHAAGFDDSVVKPFDPQAFEELLSRHAR